MMLRQTATASPRAAEARAVTRRAGRTFALASRLLPRAVRDDVYLLYLVLRTLDDLVDDGDPAAAGRLAAVEAWCAGAPASGPEATVLADIARRHPLPRTALADFCAGMRDDLDHHPPATEADVDRYCYRVAGTVGVVMTSVLGLRPGADPEAAARAAAALGIAMQRTNILRDIEEDAVAGRYYVAAESIARVGLPTGPDRGPLLRDQIARADARYEEGLAGLDALARGRTAIRAAASMYREILRGLELQLAAGGSGRVVVPARRKAVLVGRALRAAAAPSPGRRRWRSV